MRGGQLDRIIRLDRWSASAPDDMGAVTEEWSSIGTLRAQVVQSSTEEFMQSAGTTDEMGIIFRTRWVDGITTSHRIEYDGGFYNIKETKEIGRRRGLELRAVRASTT